MLKNKFLILFVLASNFLTTVGFSQKGIVLHNNLEEFWVASPNSYIYEDQTSVCTLNEVIRKNQFLDYNERNVLTKNPNSAYWIKFLIIDSRTQEVPMQLEFYDFDINEISIFLQDATGKFMKKSAGYSLPFNQREIKHKNISFLIETFDQDSVWCYIRCKSKGENLLKPVIRPVNHFIDYALKEYMLLGVFYGLMLIMIFYNLLYFILLRYSFYAYYVIFATGVLIHLMSLNGTAFQYLWPQMPQINNYVGKIEIGIALFAALLFANSFLEIKKRTPSIYKVVIGLLFARVSLLLFDIVAPEILNMEFVDLTFIQFILVIGIYSLKNGFKSAKWFVAAFCAFDVAALIMMLEHANLLPSNVFTVYALQAGIITQFVFLSISVAESIKETYEENAKSQAELIVQFKRNEELAEKVNRELELKVRQRTEEILEQKNVIEQKNKLIIDSVRYAETIQKAALPDDKTLKKIIPNHFVLLMPRDIVSGDFYWVHEISKEEYLIAAVDCTGHGIPGAFMSMIGINLLNRIVLEECYSPVKILKELHKNIHHVLKQDVTQNSDGMDMAICYVNRTKKEIRYAGARSPFIYIQNGKINRIKPTRTSIGGAPTSRYSEFEEHVISYKESPISYYLLSDGFVDQFGGPNNSKFFISGFMNKIQSIHSLPLQQQRTNLKITLVEWIGEQEVQLDDVLVIGVQEA